MIKSKLEKTSPVTGKPIFQNKKRILFSDIQKPSPFSSNRLGKSRTLHNSSVNKTGKNKKSYSFGLRKKAGFGKLLVSAAALCLVSVILGAGANLLQSVLENGGNGNNPLSTITIASAWGDSQLEVWWPTDKATVSGVQPFKALVSGKSLSDYKMYWQVDSGQPNEMNDSFSDYPHKEYAVDLSGWTWKGSGPYTLTFSAYDNKGKKFAEKFEVIYLNTAGGKAGAPLAPAATASQPESPQGSAGVSGACPEPASGAFTGCYYTEKNFTGFKFTRTEKAVDFDWGNGSPSAGLPLDDFSAIWQGNFEFEEDEYEFSVTADDGVKLYVDNEPLISKFFDQPATTYKAKKDLSPGSHVIKMQYYESSGGAVAKLSWVKTGNKPVSQSGEIAKSSSCPAAAKGTFTGCYYASKDFSNLKFSRSDEGIGFDWGAAAPGPMMPLDDFSVRWHGEFPFSAGEYDFTITADDGIRVFLDDSLVLDKFYDQPPTTYKIARTVTSGTHKIRVDYYERSGGAVAKVSWAKTGQVLSASADAEPAAPAANHPEPSAPVPGGNPLAGAKLYINPDSDAKRQAEQWRSSKPHEAALMEKVAQGAESRWFGNWNGDIQTDASNAVASAAAQGATPVFVVYNIPGRDCGNYSAGGAGSEDSYRRWIRSLAKGIGNRKAAIILEPDAITLTECLSQEQKQSRFELLKNTVTVLKSMGNTAVYLDAGHSGWLSAQDAAGKLKLAGISQADGFALNTSNFQTTQESIEYGQKLSGLVGNKHFVVDISRNGNGPAPDKQWCNPSGRALGGKPTTNTGNSLVDALLWVKRPGESDGTCNGGPSAGVWWPEYALSLAQRAGW